MFELVSVTCGVAMYFNDEMFIPFPSPANDCVVCCPQDVNYHVPYGKYLEESLSAANDKAIQEANLAGPYNAIQNASYEPWTYPTSNNVNLGTINTNSVNHDFTGNKGMCCNNQPTTIAITSKVNCTVELVSGNIYKITKLFKDYNGDFSFDISISCGGIQFDSIKIFGRFAYINPSSCDQKTNCSCSKKGGSCKKCNHL